jgi:hypothetical protein
MEKVLIIKIAKRIALNFYRCFADITIVTEKANLSRERDATPMPRNEKRTVPRQVDMLKT